MREMSEYILELKGITKIFPGVKALDNVHFQLKQGEIHALMGETVQENQHSYKLSPEYIKLKKVKYSLTAKK